MRRPSVAVVSGCFGGYDKPAAPVRQTWEPDEWVMVTDGDDPLAPWSLVREQRPSMHPRLAAKVPKCRPDWYSGADILIWVDASFEITSPEFVAWCVMGLGDAPLAQVRHPVRQSIVDEAQASVAMSKYDGLPLTLQAAYYEWGGHPADWGLWATGLIVYRRETCALMGDAWLTEQVRWTYQDQLSEPVVLRRLGILPADLSGHLWDHPHFRIRAHESEL